ncbi:hypothetical protein IC235_11880 [Hymenobacter sp. BT664]|uniref:Uncharacterized protein n=1 Tax=Hymenobacter montanus TaxID=2771359 RepID=A0A927BDV5_9BACT|nr:hypothetical protein [Hymenobacter montanus]MBD2768586.1 hypothetical protein [Hymenobacter montanus]
MRSLHVLFIIGMLPSISFAQKGFTPGTYELVDGTKGEGALKYSSGSGAELVAKPAEKGKKLTFSPQEVKSFQTADRNFVSVHDFIVDSGLPMTTKMLIKHDFAEVLDTGRVELLSYSLPMLTNKAGEARPSGDAFSTGCPLIRQRGGPLTGVPVVAKKARPIIASFIKDRPDLVERLNKEPYTAETIRGIIRAYNAGPK